MPDICSSRPRRPSRRALTALAAAIALASPAAAVRAFDRTFNVSLVKSYNPPIGAVANQYADLARQGDLVALGSVAGDGVALVDISNLAAPSFLSYYNPQPASQGGHFQDLEFKDNYLFAAVDDSGSTNGGIHVLDISNPAAPVKVAEMSQAIGGFNRNHTIFLDGDFLYAASNQNTQVKVFNVSNPAAPTLVRTITTSGSGLVHQVTVKNGRLYTSNISTLTGVDGLLEVYDVSDVASGSWSTATRRITSFKTGQRNHSSWVSEDGNLVAVCREMSAGDVQLWNISNPAAPVRVSSFTGASIGVDGYTPHNPVITGDTLYVTWYQAGLQIFNIRDPANPVHLGAYDTFAGGAGSPGALFNFYDGNWGLDVSMGVDKILLSNIDDGLHIVNATNAFRKVWTHGANNAGRWQEDARWSGDEGGGPFPDSSEMIASFTHAAAGASRTVTVDGALTAAPPRVAGIEMLKTLAYTINAANGGEIEMLASQGPATITLLDAPGSDTLHAVNAPLLLSDDLLVTNNAADNNETALQLGGIRGSGRTMTFQGTGHTAIEAANTAFTGSVVVNGGRLRLQHGQAINGQPVTLAVGQLALSNAASTDFASDVTVSDSAMLRLVNSGGAGAGGGAVVHAIGDLSVAAGKMLTLSRSGGVVGLEAGNVTLNGTLTVVPAGANMAALKVRALAIPAGGRLDLGAGGLAATATPVGTWTGSTYTGISEMIRAGRNGGGWDGSGIVTSATDAINRTDLASIGVATASQVTGIAETATTIWAGQVVTGSDTLAMLTWGGDATLDGKINIDDYGRIDSNIGNSGPPGWFNGDFNYDGKINIDDYGIIDANIAEQGAGFETASGGAGTAGGAGAANVVAVPEPSVTAAWFSVVAVALGRRRRKRLAAIRRL